MTLPDVLTQPEQHLFPVFHPTTAAAVEVQVVVKPKSVILAADAGKKVFCLDLADHLFGGGTIRVAGVGLRISPISR